MSHFWCDSTWKEIASRTPEVVLLPLGSVEAHGPHLPLSTDTIISEEVAKRAASELSLRKIAVKILSPIHYVVTDYSKDFPGTISISKSVFQDLLNDIARSVASQGIQTLCIVNSHLEPEHIAAINEFAANCKDLSVLFPDKTQKPWGSQLTKEFKQGACHAGCYETSLVLASRPELVKEEHKSLAPNEKNLAALMKEGVKSFREAGAPDAYFGNPAAATSEEGEQTYAVLTRMVVETVLSHLRKE
jgi:creatinine amidohydrolase